MSATPVVVLTAILIVAAVALILAVSFWFHRRSGR
jgi:hypothetical protein